jgi:hypothetical protein
MSRLTLHYADHRPNLSLRYCRLVDEAPKRLESVEREVNSDKMYLYCVRSRGIVSPCLGYKKGALGRDMI